jgi:endonuclease G
VSTAEVQAQQAAQCYRGCPTLSPQWAQGSTIYIARKAYALDESTATKIPLWVAEHVTIDEITGSAQRGGFRADPLLERGQRAELADYREIDAAGNHFDRGHQAPAGNHKRSQRRMDSTFYLSNMAPQQADLNRKLWRHLEEITRVWVRERGEAYEITGPIFWKGRSIMPRPTYATIGPDHVAIPTHFYKIIVAPVEQGSTEYEAIAFVAENRAYDNDFPLQNLVKSIDWIEERTGLNFMPGLRTAERKRLETTEADLWPITKGNKE